MSKVGSHDSLSTYNINYGPKKGQESKCRFDFRALKIRNCPELCAWKRHATYHWTAFNKGYNFALNLTSKGGLHKKLWTSKVTKILISRIMGHPTWESWEKCHLDVAFLVCHIKYYKGEGGGLPPKSKLWWLLWIHVCMWLICALKVFQLCTNWFIV